MWDVKDNCLERVFEFKSFAQAVEFMNKVQELANQMQHHAYWQNKIHTVSIRLAFSDEQTVPAEKDYLMADQIDHIYEQM